MFTSSSFGGPTKPNLTSGEAASQQGARKLTRKFSLEERDSSGVDQKDLSNLQKVSLLCCAVLCCAVSSLSCYRLRVVLQCHPCVSCKSLVSVLCAGMNCKLLSLGLPMMHHVPECCSPGPNLHLLL